MEPRAYDETSCTATQQRKYGGITPTTGGRGESNCVLERIVTEPQQARQRSGCQPRTPISSIDAAGLAKVGDSRLSFTVIYIGCAPAPGRVFVCCKHSSHHYQMRLPDTLCLLVDMSHAALQLSDLTI